MIGANMHVYQALIALGVFFGSIFTICIVLIAYADPLEKWINEKRAKSSENSNLRERHC